MNEDSPQPVVVGLKLDDQSLSAPSLVALRQAQDFAQKYSGKLILLSVIDLASDEEERLSLAEDSPLKAHFREVKDRLHNIAQELAESGCWVEYRVRFGKPWLVVIQEVLSCSARILFVGTGEPGTVWRALLGRTSMKLLRKCPCPVWIAKTDTSQDARKAILVAHDLKEVGQQALQWGIRISREQNRPLIVLHVVEPSRFQKLTSVLPNSTHSTRAEEARAQIQSELAQHKLSDHPQVIVEEGSPANQLHKCLETLPVHLLVMGTVARTGISGLITGNTAETVLPWVSCCLVALKPHDFVSPVVTDS